MSSSIQTKKEIKEKKLESSLMGQVKLEPRKSFDKQTLIFGLKNVSILCNICSSSKSCCFAHFDHHCPNPTLKHRPFSSLDIVEAWWVPPPVEKIPPIEYIHKTSPIEEILPTEITKELPSPPLLVDIPSIKENSTITKSIHEADNGYVLTKDNDEVVEDDTEAVGDSNKVVEDNDEVAGDDDEAIGETTSIINSRNKCEIFVNSQPMMN